MRYFGRESYMRDVVSSMLCYAARMLDDLEDNLLVGDCHAREL